MSDINEEEIWKDVVGYEGLYKVSNLGNVYSNYVHRNLKQGNHKDGYKFVILNRNGKSKYMSVHRLVATAFIPNPDDLPEINHKDETPYNNNVENLEWCDYSYNATYNDAHLKRGLQLGIPVYAYDRNGNLVYSFLSSREAERELKINSGNIIECCKNIGRTCRGFVWSQEELLKEEVLRRFELNDKARDVPIYEYAKAKLSKKVNQYDLDGNFIQSFPSTREAGKQLKFSSSLIAGVCRGNHKHTHGYIFKYA